MDNDEYVRRVLTGDKGGDSKAPPPEKEKPAEKKEAKPKERERSADRRKKVGASTGINKLIFNIPVIKIWQIMANSW